MKKQPRRLTRAAQGGKKKDGRGEKGKTEEKRKNEQTERKKKGGNGK